METEMLKIENLSALTELNQGDTVNNKIDIDLEGKLHSEKDFKTVIQSIDEQKQLISQLRLRISEIQMDKETFKLFIKTIGSISQLSYLSISLSNCKIYKLQNAYNQMLDQFTKLKQLTHLIIVNDDEHIMHIDVSFQSSYISLLNKSSNINLNLLRKIQKNLQHLELSYYPVCCFRFLKKQQPLAFDSIKTLSIAGIYAEYKQVEQNYTFQDILIEKAPLVENFFLDYTDINSYHGKDYSIFKLKNLKSLHINHKQQRNSYRYFKPSIDLNLLHQLSNLETIYIEEHVDSEVENNFNIYPFFEFLSYQKNLKKATFVLEYCQTVFCLTRSDLSYANSQLQELRISLHGSTYDRDLSNEKLPFQDNDNGLHFDNNYIIQPVINEISKMKNLKKLQLKLGGVEHFNSLKEMKESILHTVQKLSGLQTLCEVSLDMMHQIWNPNDAQPNNQVGEQGAMMLLFNGRNYLDPIYSIIPKFERFVLQKALYRQICEIIQKKLKTFRKEIWGEAIEFLEFDFEQLHPLMVSQRNTVINLLEKYAAQKTDQHDNIENEDDDEDYSKEETPDDSSDMQDGNGEMHQNKDESMEQECEIPHK